MLKYIVLYLVFASFDLDSFGSHGVRDYIFNFANEEKEIIEGPRWPNYPLTYRRFMLDRANNVLYIILDKDGYISHDGWLDNERAGVTTRILAYMHMYNTLDRGCIEGIRAPTSVAVDHVYGNVYIGGLDGLYILNSFKVPERLFLQDNVQSMYFKEKLYFINSRKQAYTYELGHVERVDELKGILVDDIVLDDDNNIFFTHMQGTSVSKVKLGTRKRVSFSRHVRTVRALVTGLDHKPYICTHDGVYEYDRNSGSFFRVYNMWLSALTFNKVGEPVGTQDYHLIYFKDNSQSSCEDQGGRRVVEGKYY